MRNSGRNSRKKNFYACFDEEGNLLKKVSGSSQLPSKIEQWKKYNQAVHGNEEFFATMKVTRGSKGYGLSPDIVMTNTDTGAIYYMFIDDFFDAIRDGNLYNGEITGMWSYTKRGNRQGIELVEEILFDENGYMIL